MRMLPVSCVANWSGDGCGWVPRSIDTTCPKCDRSVNLALENKAWEPPYKTVLAKARCPGCGESALIFVIGPGQGSETSCEGLGIYPPNKDVRTAIDGSQFIPDGVRQSYIEAIQVYNAKVWPATASLCRRTLEAVVAELTSGEESEGDGRIRSLYAMLQRLPDAVDLGKPSTALAEIVRAGGDGGAPFVKGAYPDAPLA